MALPDNLRRFFGYFSSLVFPCTQLFAYNRASTGLEKSSCRHCWSRCDPMNVDIRQQRDRWRYLKLTASVYELIGQFLPANVSA